MKAKAAFLMVASMAIFMGCGGSKATAPAGLGSKGNGSLSVPKFTKLHYYKGGWFSAPGAPTGYTDMTFEVQDDLSAKITAPPASATPTCFKVGKASEQQLLDLSNLMSQLNLVESLEEPISADQGVEYIELTLDSGIIAKFYLSNMEVPKGEFYASNGQALSVLLDNIKGTLELACQPL